MTIGRSELQQQETSAERGTVSSDTMTEISAQILTESAQKTDGDDTVHATTTTAAMDENYTKKNVNHDTRLNGGMESSDQTNHYSNKMPHTTTRRPEGEQDESLSRDDDDSDDDDSRNDRKPAAKPMKNDNENYDVSDKEECDTDDEEDESKPTSAVVVTEDGRILSDYEIQRLERIKRNRQYLAQLGLEGKEGGGGVWGERPPKKKRSRPKPVDAPVLPSRSSMSRRTKLNPVSYVEPPTSVRDLMRSDKNDKPQTDSIIHTTKITTTADTDTILATDTTTASAAAAAAETDTASTTPDADIGSTNGEQEHQQLVQPPTAKTNQLPVRKNSKKIEQPIYYEFKRIRALKRINLKKAERNFKVAEKQAMYWNKFVTVWERRNERKLEATRRRQVETAEKGMFGGKSIQDLLSEIDNRMPAIEQAIERYDDSIAAKQREQENEIKRLEAEDKLKNLEALDRFPKAMKNAVALLNAVFLECAPYDPPTPRRSKRSVVNDDQSKPPSSKKREAVTTADQWKSESLVDDHDIVLVSEEPIVVSPTADDVTDSDMERQRLAKNVGGWISPAFLKEIDRSWLQRNTPPERFDLKTYCPQVGDTVLYYITGHRQFLISYPDSLGMETGCESRVPLWERASRLKEARRHVKQLSDEPWWTADWLEGIESSNLGDYPLLCRVEGAHAEFPPDPFYKVVKTDDNHDEMKVYFKKTKGFSSWKSFGKTHMRLAVTLRPILPVVCPDWNEAGICSTTPQLALPPSFTVATFPCELEPFLIPFAWGYSLTHSLYLNQKVLIRTDDDTQVRIDHFSSLVGRDALQLEDRTAGIQSILSKLNSTFSNAGLEKDLGNYHQSVPLRDARVVLNAWYGARKRLALKDGDASSSEQSIGCFVDLLRSTLPLWNSVTVMRNMYDRKKQKISPWCVVPAGKVKVFMSPWTLGEQVFRLEENLRVKIKCLLEDFVAGDQAVMEMFYHPVTDEVAPAYFCAVPVGKAFADIVQRLQLNGKQNACYYRSVDAIIADVESILECCLLYNSPDSEVVEEAARIVDTVKVQIARVTREYYREIKEARKMDEDWRLRVRRQCQFRTTFANIMKRPFREQLHRDWLDQTHDVCDPLKPLPNMIVDLNKPDAPVFQAGDMVLYSRELHCSFVKGHRTALEYDQCLVPSHESVFGQESSGLRVEDEWARGVIIWTRSSFPKASSKQSGGDTTTFPTLATLQCLGIKFRHSGNVCVLYWRPCLFQFDSSASTTCPVCGLFSSSSFVRFDCNGSLTAAVDLIAERENEVADSAMSTHLLQSLDRCLNLFKRRCIRAIHPDYIDPMLSKDNVKSGYKPPILKIGKNTLPSFERLFSIFPIKNVANTTHQGTRGISLKPKEKDPDVSLLVDVGFLPLWVSSDSGGIADDDQLRKVQALLPSPKLCLELVQLRIRNNFYRHKAAIENDIVEAYLYTMFALLVEPASRKRSPLSIERVARFLLVITKNIDGTRLDSEYAMMNEEFAWAQRLRTVQALYATALVSVSDTSHVERAFGLVGYSPPKPTKECDDQDLIRVAARQSLAFLVSAFGREKFLNVFHGEGKEDLVPQIKLTIKCGGELFTFSKDRFSPSGAQLLARLNDTTVKVNLICEGSPLGVNNAVRASLSQSIGANQKSRADYQGKRVAPPIYLGPKDCEHNDSLARMLFNRPGRTDACARCQAFKRSMLSCRVLCRHSNSDFNWVAVLSDGVGYVDDLLKVLSFEAPNELDAKIAVQDGGHKKNGFNNHEGVILNEDTSDPREFNKKAVSVLKLATENLKEAKLFAAAPARLSKDFVKKSFPIDLSDGHYLYCVICGSSGDLLCCDGCPNVVHGDCVELSDLPDGDWYCEECCAEKSTGSSEGLDLSEKGSLTPFGRVELDESKVELLSTLLDELRNARPTPKRSSNDDAMENPDSNGRSSKKRRGRPRKHTRLALGDGLGEGSDGDGPSLGSQSDGTFPKKKRSLPRNKFRSNQATGDERSEVSRSRSAKTENETCVNRSGPNTDEDIILKRTRKRRRKSTDALDIDLSRARHLSRRRLVVKTQPPANEDVNIVRKISGRRNLKRRLSTSPNAKPVIQLSAQGLKGVRNFASFPFHDTFPQPVLIKAKADGIGSEVLSVDSSSSVPRRNRSSPRKSCPPIRFVDTI